ncbi:MAG TPA: DUF4846 domain-containing protein [Chitinophagaceae bacterium]
MNLLWAPAIILPYLWLFQPVVPTCSSTNTPTAAALISDIKLPDGFERIPSLNNSFAAWLKERRLKPDKTVFLYNGLPKRNQDAQYAVIDISTGNEDLQQCADAVMRLRAEYLYANEKWAEIVFKDNANKAYYYQNGKDRAAFDRYLRKVFGWCGTASLEKQLRPVRNIKEIMAGDVFIKGGFPGHAVIVMDVAQNNRGEKIFLLAQGYMPAQDIHLLKNPKDQNRNPWYKATENQLVITPEWTFQPSQLRRW